MPLVTIGLALLVLAGCAFQAPAYSWQRPGASLAFSEQDRAALNADEDACAEERNRSGLTMFRGAAWYDATQRTLYKDCHRGARLDEGAAMMMNVDPRGPKAK